MANPIHVSEGAHKYPKASEARENEKNYSLFFSFLT